VPAQGRASIRRAFALAGALGAAAACPDPVGIGDGLSIAVDPPSATVHLADAMVLSAIVREASGAAVTRPAVFWTSSDSGVARVDTIGGVPSDSSAYATVRPVRPGSVTITATSGDARDSARIDVVVGPLSSIIVLPTAAGIAVGDQLPVTVEVRDHQSYTVPGRAVAWTSSAPNVASVAVGPVPPDSLRLSSAATVTAAGVGVALITATLGDKADTAVVTVGPRPPTAATVAIEPLSATVYATRGRTLRAVARDAAGNVIPGLTLRWATSDSSVASVRWPCGSACDADSAAALVTGAGRLGSVTIRATATGGANGAATVTVAPTPATAMFVAPAAALLALHSQRTLRAWIGDSVSPEIGGISATWRSSDTSVATVRDTSLPYPAAIVVANGVGTATITASCLPGSPTSLAVCQGLSATATVTVALTVPPAPDTITAFRWLRHSRGLVYAGASAGTLQELWYHDAGGGDVSLAPLGSRPARAVAEAPDGSAFYAVLEGPGGTGPGSLVRVSRASGAVATLADSVDACGWFCAILEVSPTGRYVLYRGFPSGDVRAYDVSLARTAVVGPAAPRAFSPNGREVLVRGFTDSAWSRVDLATGQRTTLPGIPSGAVAAVWDALGIHILRLTGAPGGWRFAIIELAAGTERVAADGIPIWWVTEASLSPDLAHVAYLAPGWRTGRTPPSYPLDIVDVGTGQIWDLSTNCSLAYWAPGATVGSAYTSPPAFSPDSRAIACIAGGRLTALGVP